MEYKPPPTNFIALRLVKRIWSILQVIPALIRFGIGCRHSLAQQRIRAFLTGIHTSNPSSSSSSPTKIGVAGFCWGGRFTVELTHDTPSNTITLNHNNGQEQEQEQKQLPLITCAFTAHPSLLSIPQDIEKVSLPLSLANGDDDSFMGSKKLAKVREILDRKNREFAADLHDDVPGDERHEVVVYPGAQHGFAVRRDWDDPSRRECRDGCEDQAVRWFRRHFNGDC
jgi:dienelactone hydrolase